MIEALARFVWLMPDELWHQHSLMWLTFCDRMPQSAKQAIREEGITSKLLPVVCSHCKAYYGLCSGGNLRIGCAACQNTLAGGYGSIINRITSLSFALAIDQQIITQHVLREYPNAHSY